MVYQTQKQLKEFDEKLPQDVKDKVNAALTPLKEALETATANELQVLMDKLQEEVMSMGQAMYGGPQSDAGPGKRGSKDDDVIDADFR